MLIRVSVVFYPFLSLSHFLVLSLKYPFGSGKAICLFLLDLVEDAFAGLE